MDRVSPYWEQELKPAILSGKRIIISAHGNSLRALVKFIEHISDKKIIDLEIPTGQPLIYHLRESDLKVEKRYYLNDALKKNITFWDKIKSLFK